MGCDGGTIPRRNELVKLKKKPEVKDKDAERLYRWQHCAVSQSLLKHPIVACELGRLYSKDEVISRLIEKSDDTSMEHIKSLKDVKELTLTHNPSYREVIPLGDEYLPSQRSEYICPVTAQEMNGKSGFSFVWSCGCVVSNRSLKEVKTITCHVCNKPFRIEDIIPLNPAEEQIPLLRERMLERRAQAKAAKKSKKEKRAVENATPSEPKRKKMNSNDGASSSKSQKSIVSSMATNVLKTDEFEKISSDKFSVASDPKKSEVYKSIFDTHKSAQGKTTSHWVTCNPQYF